MRLFAIAALLSLTASAQVVPSPPDQVYIGPPLNVGTAPSPIHLTMSQQGAASLRTIAGKRVKGVGVLAIIVENRSQIDEVIDPGRIYAAVGHAGVSFISPNVAAATIAQARASSWKVMLLEGVTLGAQGTGMAGLIGAIKMPNGLGIILSTVVPLVVNYAKNKLTQLQPEPTITPLLNETIRVPEHTTATVYIAYRYQGSWAPKEADLP